MGGGKDLQIVETSEQAFVSPEGVHLPSSPEAAYCDSAS